MTPDPQTELQKIEAVISAQEALRGILPDEQIEATLTALRQQKATYLARADHGSAVAQDGATAIARQGVGVTGNVSGSTINTGLIYNVYQSPPGEKRLLQPEARRQYLDHIIATHQHLRLQGISAGSQPLSVSLEKVYVSLTAMDQRAERGKKLARKDGLQDERLHSGALTVASALQRYRRLVVIGDPGCGKTTLLSYLALTYARQNAETTTKRLALAESDYLPVILPLRNFGYHLRSEHPDSGKDGPTLLLHYLYDYFAAQKIALPDDFFEQALKSGHGHFAGRHGRSGRQNPA